MMRFMSARPDLLEALAPHPALDALADEPGAYVVGGAVRDVLLGRAPHELDILVEGDAAAVAKRAAARLGGEAVVHDRFGTATVRTPEHTFDVAGARRESYARPGALPDVELGATAQEDLARRDLTVNALALRLSDAELLSWPGALEDLATGRLRVLHDASYRDDPTRMLRTARYAARLGFEVEPHTDELWAAAVPGVGNVTGSRLGEELRLLLREPQPEALQALARHGLGAAVLGLPLYPDPDRIDAAIALTPPDGRADLAALAACLDGGDVAPALDRLEFTARERDVVTRAVGAAIPSEAADDDLWRALRDVPVEAVAVAGVRDEPAARRWIDELRPRHLQINGDDLVAAGLYGPAGGAALDAAMDAYLRGEAPDRESQLAAALRGAS
jgi:tRNA nucleotidyltransferase (CCA-adding enzyme)